MGIDLQTLEVTNISDVLALNIQIYFLSVLLYTFDWVELVFSQFPNNKMSGEKLSITYRLNMTLFSYPFNNGKSFNQFCLFMCLGLNGRHPRWQIAFPWRASYFVTFPLLNLLNEIINQARVLNPMIMHVKICIIGQYRAW